MKFKMGASRLVGALSLTEDDRIGWEDGKLGMEFLKTMVVSTVFSCPEVGLHGESMPAYKEEVKLIRLAANAVGKEQGISLQPRHGLRRILETNTRAAHDDDDNDDDMISCAMM